MFDRKTYFSNAMDLMKDHFLRCILLCFVFSFLGLALTNNSLSSYSPTSITVAMNQIKKNANMGAMTGYKNDWVKQQGTKDLANVERSGYGAGNQLYQEYMNRLYAAMGVLVVIGLVLQCLRYLFGAPFLIGANSYLLAMETEDKPGIGLLFKGFRIRTWLKSIGALLLKDCLIGLASMLFFFPGIYLSYCYRLVMPILAENPDISVVDALRLSRDMMNGYKFDCFKMDVILFVLQLLTLIPVLGWLGGVLFINPFIRLVNMEMYDDLANGYRNNKGILQTKTYLLDHKYESRSYDIC